MNRTVPSVIAALLVVGALGAFPATVFAQQTDASSANENANETAPGAQLAGVVGVQEAEFEGEVQERAYGIELAQANSSDAKAEVVAERLAEIEDQIADLENRNDELEDARENGSMSEGEYRAEVAKAHAESKSVDRLVNKSNETAQELPEDVLSENGVNVSAIQTLKDRSEELSGPETAAIATSIAGENVGVPATPEEAAQRGGDAADGDDSVPENPADAGNQTDAVTTDEDPADAGNQTDGNETAPADAAP